MQDVPFSRISDDVELPASVRLVGFVNLYGCKIGEETFIGPFVEVQSDASIGARCKIQSHSFICSGVTIEDGVFIGHGVMFTNDRHPRAIGESGELVGEGDWQLERTVVRAHATVGSGAVILPGVEIGSAAVVGAGAVVTSNVAAGSTVAGVPARSLR